MMIAKALEAYGSVFTSQQNYNTLIGVSIDLCRCPLGANFAVLEVGMNKPGEIDSIVQLIRPNVALLVTVAENHIEAFESIEGIAYEKAQIFQGLSAKGVAVYNLDMPCLSLIAPLIQRLNHQVSFSRQDSRADVYLQEKEDGSKWVRAGGQEVQLELKEIGDHLYSNALAAVSVVHALGLKINMGVQNLRTFHLPHGRGDVKEVKITKKEIIAIDLIDDSYNASFTSTQAALRRLNNLKSRGRKLFVFGDMLELGKDAQEWHMKLVPEIISSDIEGVFCCGAMSEKLFRNLPQEKQGHWCPTSVELHGPLLSFLKEGDMVLVKASNGTNMRALLSLLTMEK
jgi:UDP-N-acetylmuramoyl-tripeptide--D-alanyl-D-alanine ligase